MAAYTTRVHVTRAEVLASIRLGWARCVHFVVETLPRTELRRLDDVRRHQLVACSSNPTYFGTGNIF